MKDIVGEEGREHQNGHTAEGRGGHQSEDAPDVVVLPGITEAVDQVFPGRIRARRLEFRQTHHQQTRDDRHKADPVDQEAHAFADGRDQQSGHSRTQNPGRIEHRRVQRDGIEKVVLAGHVDDERLPAGHVEGIDYTQEAAQRENVPDLHASGERQRGQGERLQHGKGLGDDDELLTRESVGRQARPEARGRKLQFGSRTRMCRAATPSVSNGRQASSGRHSASRCRPAKRSARR